jgi:hypothetical protein
MLLPHIKTDRSPDGKSQRYIYSTVIGIDFIDQDGYRIRNFSLIGEDGKAQAIADFEDAICQRCANTAQVEEFMPEWSRRIKEIVTST